MISFEWFFFHDLSPGQLLWFAWVLAFAGENNIRMG
jgi:hypothetical protein